MPLGSRLERQEVACGLVHASDRAAFLLEGLRLSGAWITEKNIGGAIAERCNRLTGVIRLSRMALSNCPRKEKRHKRIPFLRYCRRSPIVSALGLCPESALRIGAKKTRAIEMNEVVRIFGDPHFRFP